MADDYTPSEEHVSVAWIEYDDAAGDINEAEAEFDRFIAQVRRDAAREALDAFTRAEIDQAPDSPVNAGEEQEPLTYRELAQAAAWRAAGWNTIHYPIAEETP